MVYTITRTRSNKRVVLKSFAGMILWASDPKWQWTVGLSVERVLRWVEDPPGRMMPAKRHMGAMRWSVSE